MSESANIAHVSIFMIELLSHPRPLIVRVNCPAVGCRYISSGVRSEGPRTEILEDGKANLLV